MQRNVNPQKALEIPMQVCNEMWILDAGSLTVKKLDNQIKAASQDTNKSLE